MVAVVANAAAFVLIRIDRTGTISRTPVAVCRAQLAGSGSPEEQPQLVLSFAQDSGAVTGLDSAGLRRLGFSGADLAILGQRQPGRSEYRWPRPRPAWVRLRQSDSAGRGFQPVEVARSRTALPPDSTSIVVRARVGLGLQFPAAPRDSDHVHRPGEGATVVGRVFEILPARLYLERPQFEAVRDALTDSSGCSLRRAVLASASGGGLWVAEVR